MKRGPGTSGRLPRLRFPVYDFLFIAIAVVLCVIPNIGGLGFYSDDWSFWERIAAATHHSFWGLYRALAGRGEVFRPGQVLYIEISYLAFGLDPLGYHILNVGVLVLVGIGLYIVLRQFTNNRILALSIAMVFSILPNYSTDRFWISASQANVSTVLYLASLYLSLKALNTKAGRMWLLAIGGFVCLLGSVSAYELTLPLFAFNLLLLLHKYNQLKKSGRLPAPKFNLWLVFTGTFLGILLCGLFKLMTTTRYHPSYNHFAWLTDTAKQVIRVHFIDYGVGLPGIDLTVLRGYSPPVVWILAVALGIGVFVYLRKGFADRYNELPDLKGTLQLVGIGLVVTALGYSIFWFAPGQVGFSMAGPNNRTAEVACLGVATAFVGGASLLSILGISENLRKTIFCLVISFVAISGILVNNYIGYYWTQASRKQEAILRAVKAQFPIFPRGKTLLVDGFCPYAGPAVVFEAHNDMSAALSLLYTQPNINADVITRKVQIHKEFISTSWYMVPRPYQYGKDLLVFNVRRQVVRQLTSANVARTYFRNFNPDRGNGCPSGREGYGVPLFYLPDKDLITQIDSPTFPKHGEARPTVYSADTHRRPDSTPNSLRDRMNRESKRAFLQRQANLRTQSRIHNPFSPVLLRTSSLWLQTVYAGQQRQSTTPLHRKYAGNFLAEVSLFSPVWVHPSTMATIHIWHGLPGP